MPGRTCRPATRPSTPTVRGAAIRASTRSTTCSAAVRPNRPIKTRGSGSLFSMVPFNNASSITACSAPLRYSSITSFPSSWLSSSTATRIVLDVCPGRNSSVPDAAT